MTRRAWAYVIGVLLLGLLLTLMVLLNPWPASLPWDALIALILLATLAHLSKALGPSHEAWNTNLVFLFAGVVLLPSQLFIFLVVVPHMVEWIRERLRGSNSLRNWYIQPFNIAVHVIAGVCAHWLFSAISPPSAGLHTVSALLGMLVAVASYAVLNHYLVGQALVLARGISWQESGILNPENLAADLTHLVLGYTVAVLWQFNPLLILPAMTPLWLIFRSLRIPQLKKEAQTDSKTGLLNARYWREAATAELERAKRFDRPMALIMADLDLLRSINNLYGHLAGDEVLQGIGHIIDRSCREYDVTGRFGGEEFAIALPEVGQAEARAMAERLRRQVEAAAFPIQTNPTPIRISMSFGVAAFPEDGTTLDQIIHQADLALYQAKLRGRNRVISTSEIPHSLHLATAIAENGHGADTPAMGESPVQQGLQPGAPPDPTPVLTPAPALSSASENLAAQPVLLKILLASVIITALAVSIAGILVEPMPGLVAIVLFALLAAMAELLQIDIYGSNSVSVSAALNFAAALAIGIPGIIVVSAAIALSPYLLRPRPLYKMAYNWGVHVLAALFPMLMLNVLGMPLQLANLPWLAIPLGLASLLYFVVETVLVALASALSQKRYFAALWIEQFRWLAGHYVVLGVLGTFLTIAYSVMGPAGLLVFILPLGMMHLVQRQYLAQTRISVLELRRMNEELSRANEEVLGASYTIRQLNDELFLTLAKIIDLQDPYVHNHAVKVADYAIAIADQMGLSLDRAKTVSQAALLHDIGKIAIPEEILHKPAQLTGEEYELVKTHVDLGSEFLGISQGLRQLAPFVRHHHERWDGSGYPDGLQGEDIPLESRILGVCDAVEAMASDRPYHEAMSVAEIIHELRRHAGSQFDPNVVQAFIQVAQREGTKLVVNSAREVQQKQELQTTSQTNSRLSPVTRSDILTRA